jgi:hypothetical protein
VHVRRREEDQRHPRAAGHRRDHRRRHDTAPRAPAAGEATVDEVDGIVPEYRLAHLRYAGPEQGEANVAAVDNPGVRMARIGLRPSWVGVLDFVSRLPGGVSADEFDKRGA